MSASDNKVSEDVKKSNDSKKLLIDEFGQTALHWAAGRGNCAAVEALLDILDPEDIRKQAPGNNNYTALHLAVHSGDPQVVKLFIEKKRKNNSPNQGDIIGIESPDIHGQTPLHWAASTGKTEIAKALIGVMEPAQISAKTKEREGYTALHFAVQANNIELVQYLCDLCLKQRKSKSSEIDLGIPDIHGQTPLHWAASTGKTEIVKALIDALTPAQISAKAKEREDYTALHFAVQSNNIEVVKCLLATKNSELINSMDRHGQTALHWASAKGLVEITKALLEAMKDSSIILEQAKDNNNYTALHLAVQSESIGTAEAFFKDSSIKKLLDIEDIHKQKPRLWATHNPLMVKLFDEYVKSLQDADVPQQSKIGLAVSKQNG